MKWHNCDYPTRLRPLLIIREPWAIGGCKLRSNWRASASVHLIHPEARRPLNTLDVNQDTRRAVRTALVSNDRSTNISLVRSIRSSFSLRESVESHFNELLIKRRTFHVRTHTHTHTHRPLFFNIK